MRSAPCAAKPSSRTHRALHGFIEECRDAALRIAAYVGALALIAVAIFHAADPLTDFAVRSVDAEAIAAWAETECRPPTRAEPKRAPCPLDRLTSVSADWTTAGGALGLRGGLSTN